MNRLLNLTEWKVEKLKQLNLIFSQNQIRFSRRFTWVYHKNFILFRFTSAPEVYCLQHQIPSNKIPQDSFYANFNFSWRSKVSTVFSLSYHPPFTTKNVNSASKHNLLFIFPVATIFIVLEILISYFLQFTWKSKRRPDACRSLFFCN